jgi:putative peptidoglycan binding protein
MASASVCANGVRPPAWRRWFDAVGTAVVGAVSGETVVAGQPALETAALQHLLGDAGLLVPVTGRLDGRTVAVLRRFQRSVGLRPDGVAGPRTVHALCRATAGTRELRELGLVA